MAIQYTAGQSVTATMLNLLAPLFAQKGTDQSVTNSAVLVNDNDIVFTLAANQTVEMELHAAALAGSTAPGIAIGYTLTGTVSVTTRLGQGPPAVLGGNTPSGTTVRMFEFNSTAGAGYALSTSEMLITEYLILATGASGGTIRLQFAQGAATAGVSTTLRAGTFAIARYVA